MKNKHPKISVIIPCYNYGQYLDEAVDSVLAQTFQDFEIIIVNDGSTDKFTNELLENYQKPKTRVLHTRNNGLASTRNFGFQQAKGELIQFLDADDTLLPTKFEKQARDFADDPSLGVSYTGYKYLIHETRLTQNKELPMALGQEPYNDFLYRWQRSLSIPIHSGLFKRELWKQSVPFVTGFKAIEDWIMWIGISRQGAKFNFIDEDLVMYRIQQDNMSRNPSFMIYWVARAISYIADHLIDEDEVDNYNLESEKYLKFLIDTFFVTNIKQQLNVSQQQLNVLQKQIQGLKRSYAYRIGRLVTFLPRKLFKE